MSKQAVKMAATKMQVESGEIPEGWTEVFLGDVAYVRLGKTPRKKDYRDNGLHRVIKFRDVTNTGLSLSTTKAGFVADDPEAMKGLRPLHLHDVLVTASAHSGDQIGKKCTYVDKLPDVSGNVYFVGELLAITADRQVMCAKWPYLWFLSDAGISAIQKAVYGVHLTAGRAQNISIPVAPLSEQKRIVTQVEALLTRVNAAREHLSKVPAILKRFRQSVLAAACSGQLTADWREDEIREGELPESWQRKRLGELCNGFQYGSSKKSSEEGEVPVLRMGNIQDRGVDWNDLVYSTDSKEIEKYRLSPNTVLFNRTNSPELVGKTGIYRGERQAIFAGYLIRIDHGPELNPGYLNYCLNAPEFREYCAYVRTDGVSQSNINAKKLAAYEMPWCDLEEQQEIVHRVEELFALADRIEQRAKAATERVEKTTQSILARAFRGELVETEAELARREGRDYETAAQLLARIQAERATESGGHRRDSPKRQRRRNNAKIS